MRGSRLLIGLVVVCAGAGATAVVAAGGGSESSGERVAAQAPLPGPIPERSSSAKVVEPVAGEVGEAEEEVVVDEDLPVDVAVPVVKANDDGVDLARVRAGKIADESEDGGDAVSKATVLANGVALPPLDAPEEVKRIISAGNQIARSPYVWGGGHGKWLDKGYDCSGSVSFALAAAGLLDAPLASGPFMKWGEPGKGKWVTLYTNPGHIFMVVAGVRFDTSGRSRTGSRWQNSMRSGGSYVVRHPPGL